MRFFLVSICGRFSVVLVGLVSRESCADPMAHLLYTISLERDDLKAGSMLFLFRIVGIKTKYLSPDVLDQKVRTKTNLDAKMDLDHTYKENQN